MHAEICQCALRMHCKTFHNSLQYCVTQLNNGIIVTRTKINEAVYTTFMQF